MAGLFVFCKLASSRHLSSKPTRRSLFPGAAEASRNFNTFPSVHPKPKISCPAIGLPSVDHINRLIKPYSCVRGVSTTALFSTTAKDRLATMSNITPDAAFDNMVTFTYCLALCTLNGVFLSLESKRHHQSGSSECCASSSNDQGDSNHEVQ